MGSGINRKSSIKLTLRFAAAEEGKNNNNNNNNPVVKNVQCWKGHTFVIPKTGAIILVKLLILQILILTVGVMVVIAISLTF